MVKKLVIILSSIIIIAFSFIMPKLFFQLEDLSRENEIFTRPKKESNKIDVQAEKIYLVKFIHNIYEFKDAKISYSDSKKVSVSIPLTKKTSNTAPTEELKNEISKLITSEIMKDVNLDEFIDFDETANIFFSEYTVITSDLVSEKEGVGVCREEKTGKIISIDFPKTFLRSDVALKKQLQNYAKYLDLDIIGDWKYENQTLKSEKAQLSIILEEKGNVCMLTVAPTEMYDEYKDSKYEIVEKKN